MNATNELYITQALHLAEKGRFSVSPNPLVGCLVVKEDVIVGQGYHQRAGEAHAEIFALREAGENARGAVVYVTLEPCCHYGKTPPCTEALIRAGVKKVVIACQDPNPLVSGKGIQALHEAGIETVVNVKEKEAKEQNKIFFHYMANQRPFVIMKWAMSLDGKTITHPKDNRMITSADCQKHAHQIRRAVDAILIGAKTALLDNPQLTVRHQETSSERQPLRIVLSTSGNLPLDLTLFSPHLPGKTLIVTTDKTDKDWLKKAEAQKIPVWILPRNDKQRVDLSVLLKKLGEHQISSLLVEGGEQVRNAFFSEKYVDEIQVYLAPVFIGDLEQKLPLSSLRHESLENALFIRSRL